MSAINAAPRVLPAKPSNEHLRKQAKRLAKARSLGLAAAQRQLAMDYGASSWVALMRRVEEAVLSPLATAARAGDLAALRRLIAEGAAPDAASGGRTPLWHACDSAAPAADRIAVAAALLDAGVNPRRDDGGSTALHAAAARGSLALVELLIRRGALDWQPDAKGRPALAAAKRGLAPDKAAIVALLDRAQIRDPSFRAAVTELQRGHVAALSRRLDAEPRLLRERIREPDCYREAVIGSKYFLDPKLFWFIANNPTRMRRMPTNIVAVAQAMIDRGVDPADLDYTLELVMTSQLAREQGYQIPLLRAIVAAGGRPTEQAIVTTLAHWEIEPIEALLAAGRPLNAIIAAGLGRAGELRRLLAAAGPAEVQTAFGLAVINRHNDCARLALDAGADVNGFLPVHSHSLALHQAAIDENLELIELLVARGARTDIPDKLWGATPFDWAQHQNKAKSVARLQRLSG